MEALTESQWEDLFDDYAREHEMFEVQITETEFRRYTPSEAEYNRELELFKQQYQS